MTEKNASYKLDFSFTKKFSFMSDAHKYPLDQINTFDRRYWRSKNRSFLRDIVTDYEDSNRQSDFWDIAKSDPDYATTVSKHNVALTEFERAIKVPKIVSDSDVRYQHAIDWDCMNAIHSIAKATTRQTPEFKEVQASFQKWLKRRNGVAEAWKKYVEENNAAYSHVQLNPVVTLEELADNKSSSTFRKHLETNRPTKFYPGVVVKLKDEYLDKRGKDPLYYNYDMDLKKQPRVGVVVEQKNRLASGVIGEGSRMIQVAWFSTGEECAVMERCLQSYEE